MALKVPTASQLRLLDKLTAAYASTMVMGLFKGNITPALGDTAATYLAQEADYSGYARQTVGPWGAATTVAGHAVSTAPTLTFTNTTGIVGNDVYGYFVLDGSGNLLWAERDPFAPVHLQVAGDSYSIIPTFSDTTEY